MNILVVDDTPKNIQVLGITLKNEGYQVGFAQNGEKALKMISGDHFHLILLDVMMPGMDGFETCKQIKKNPEYSDIPVIFLSAKTDQESIVKGFEAGGVDYITKPFNKPEVLARVKTHLELLKHKEKLKEAIATKDKFFSIISHDLKNPCGSMYGLLHLFKNKYNKFSDEKRMHFITVLLRASINVQKLLDDILDWSRIERGVIKFSPMNIKISDRINEVIELYSEQINDKQLTAINNCPDDFEVYGDINMLNTILRNVLSNAIKFTPQEGNIEAGCSMLHNEKALIYIKDSGVGISGEDINKLFDKKETYSTRGTDSEPGTGLGLTLCKEFVHKHQGDIWVESAEQKGSTFFFTLPVKNS